MEADIGSIVEREELQAQPDAINPFVNDCASRWTTLSKLRIGAGAVLLMPLRIVGMLSMMCVFEGILQVALLGVPRNDIETRARNSSDKKDDGDGANKLRMKPAKSPFTGWRASLLDVARRMVRGFLFTLGVTKFTTKGTLAHPTCAPILVCAPHSTPIDIFVVLYTCFGSFVSAASNTKYPLVGTGLRALQCILVEREAGSSKRAALDEIIRRARAAGSPGATLPHLIMFPEGTTSNRKCLLEFKHGAFAAGMPVQPVLLRYLFQDVDFAWVDDAPSIYMLLLGQLSAWRCEVEVEFLEPVTPSAAELQAPALFAERVRTAMANALEIPKSKYSVDDMLMMKSAMRLGLPAESGMVEFWQLKQKLNVDLNSLKKLMADFAAMDKNADGSISLEEFSQFLGLPITDRVRRLFAMYDVNRTGAFHFREYIIAMMLVTSPDMNEQHIEQGFKFLDVTGSGRLTRENFVSMFSMVLARAGVDVEEGQNKANAVFDFALQVCDIQGGENGESPTINYDQFKLALGNKPQFANLLTDVLREVQSEKQLAETLI
ncbi:Lysophosphatidylcholine acyltransferase 2 [Porphyridium purpureum]|uniref:Lysophosphatidylcholine acyltransferase 2 n=1 Tax=Porphyridium purpureum TaxID=35688 RepID=A0A5J4YTI6_PORPP|nr:Lysophosphatidylcholine acyltransferase 2 [Porphyridium purpureum]|eukprot:POR5564..scf229_5